ncbi:hypothetical protein MUU72_04725 [Streptomyces sp. RS10V-4]|uniref:hypothetical protein n=1 Tax=Streptomyces rhizoryzae TaxID=2932493 RepID=UPI00200425AE|nr:hypothetical protein [Streptomyces rhizoryzae]MCK7622425.1 hypothetical protein [Streptomyces rhizoryzae]
MSMRKRTGVRLGVLPVAALALLAAGCGTQRPGADSAAGTPSRAAAVQPSRPGTPADFPCPGETPAPSPSPSAQTSGPAGPPLDHYAENHGFRNPLPLHGQRRCDGLAAVKRVKHALDPLRAQNPVDPDRTRRALTALGYPAAGVEVSTLDPGVGFLVNASPLCIEGKVNAHFIEANAFGGYPDGTGCKPPSGGH